MSEGVVAVPRELLERVVDRLWSLQNSLPPGSAESDQLIADLAELEMRLANKEFLAYIKAAQDEN